MRSWRTFGSSSWPPSSAAFLSILKVGWLILPAPAVPMATRSYMSIAVAWFQPLFSSPSRWSAGTRTSVKNTSLKCEPPSIWWIGRTSTPGASIGRMNIEMPACFTASGSVRAISTAYWLLWASVVQTFWPLMIHSSPSRSALVWRLATSEPAPGSENIWHHRVRPAMLSGM